MNEPIIGFVGMTHLGLISGICAAEKGFKVVCFDRNQERIASLVAQKLPVSEPHLDELADKNKNRMKAGELQKIKESEKINEEIMLFLLKRGNRQLLKNKLNIKNRVSI